MARASIATTRRRFLGYFSSVGLSSTLLPGVLWAQMQEKSSARVTSAMLKEALAVAGLEFSDEERQSILNGVNQNLTRLEELRKIPIDPMLGPPMYYSPLVPGARLDRSKKPFRTSVPPSVKRPSNLDDVAFWPITNLASLVKSRQVKSVELTEMYLARLQKYNRTINCVVTLTEDLAMKQARQADAEIAAGRYLGPLHGIPWGCKDIIAVPGYPTTWGSNAYKDQMFAAEATVVRQLREAGAVLVAKLTTGELASGDRWFGGQTKNPWDLNQGSSGSSAGPGSATGAGLVAFAIGTETSGSILYPATRCGATALRPTFGRVSRYGAMTLAWTRDRLGPFCRSVEDVAIVFNVIARPDEQDLSVIDLPFNWDANLDVKSLRVGYLEPAPVEDGRNEEWVKNDHQVLAQLRSMGIKLEAFTLPKFQTQAVGSASGAESGASFDDLLRSGRYKLLGTSNRANNLRSSRLIPAVEFLQSLRVRHMVMKQLADIVGKYDVFITSSQNPTLATDGGRGGVGGGGGGGGENTPPTLNREHFDAFNVCGYPALSLPTGHTADGHPTSTYFMGKLYGEAEILALAKAYQDATKFNEKHPMLTA